MVGGCVGGCGVVVAVACCCWCCCCCYCGYCRCFVAAVTIIVGVVVATSNDVAVMVVFCLHMNIQSICLPLTASSRGKARRADQSTPVYGENGYRGHELSRR